MTLYEYSMLAKNICREYQSTHNGKCAGCPLLDEKPSMSMCMAMFVFGDFDEEPTRKLYADRVERTLNTYARELYERRRAKNLLKEGLQKGFPDMTDSAANSVVNLLVSNFCPFIFFKIDNIKMPSCCNDDVRSHAQATSCCQNECWQQYISDGNEPQRLVVGK